MASHPLSQGRWNGCNNLMRSYGLLRGLPSFRKPRWGGRPQEVMLVDHSVKSEEDRDDGNYDKASGDLINLGSGKLATSRAVGLS